MTDDARVELAPGYSISRIINGCWQLTPDHGGGTRSARETLCRFGELVDAGFTTFDCADIYTGTEELLGRFRRSLPDPSAIEVHTKYVPDRGSLAGLTDRAIDEAVERSLGRLGVERLDLLQFHWWSYDVPGLERVTERLVRAQQDGRIRLLGATNFDTAHVRQMLDAGVPLVALQAQYSLLDRRPEKHMAACAAETGVRLLAYGTLAGGFFSERWLDSAPPREMNRSLTKYRLMIDEAGGWPACQRLLALLADVAAGHGTSIASVATRWVLDQPAVAAVILGTGSRSRVRENAALATFRLDEAAGQRLRRAVDALRQPPGDMYDLERDPDGPHARIIRTDLHDAGAPVAG